MEKIEFEAGLSSWIQKFPKDSKNFKWFKNVIPKYFKTIQNYAKKDNKKIQKIPKRLKKI